MCNPFYHDVLLQKGKKNPGRQNTGKQTMGILDINKLFAKHHLYKLFCQQSKRVTVTDRNWRVLACVLFPIKSETTRHALFICLRILPTVIILWSMISEYLPDLNVVLPVDLALVDFYTNFRSMYKRVC